MWYAVYNIEDGRLVSSGSSAAADDTLAAKGLAAKGYAERPAKLWNPATLDYDLDPPPAPVVLTLAAFKRRFTLTEHAAVMGLARTHDRLSAFMDRLASQEAIDMSDPEIGMLLDFLVSQGILTATRKTEIMI